MRRLEAIEELHLALEMFHLLSKDVETPLQVLVVRLSRYLLIV